MSQTLALSMLLLLATEDSRAHSTCYGSVSNGHLQGGVPLPLTGANFAAYSPLGALLGRTYVHATVARIVEQAYAALADSDPQLRFVYGETGWPLGGRFAPHRTHQNGLSVDFFVPVRDAAGNSVTLPGSHRNRYGYDLEFDAQGRWNELSIDFPALAAHLYQLDLAARRNEVSISRVIFDTAYLDRLLATPHGARIRQLPFMRSTPWVRHDEHVHVDFHLPCQP